MPRVWLPNNDSPGLAMARAFGDFCLKDFGLISVPEVSYRRLTDRDEFIVLATDGVYIHTHSLLFLVLPYSITYCEDDVHTSADLGCTLKQGSS